MSQLPAWWTSGRTCGDDIDVVGVERPTRIRRRRDSHSEDDRNGREFSAQGWPLRSGARAPTSITPLLEQLAAAAHLRVVSVLELQPRRVHHRDPVEHVHDLRQSVGDFRYSSMNATMISLGGSSFATNMRTLSSESCSETPKCLGFERFNRCRFVNRKTETVAGDAVSDGPPTQRSIVQSVFSGTN
jgi:hypothetical protein